MKLSKFHWLRIGLFLGMLTAGCVHESLVVPDTENPGGGTTDPPSDCTPVSGICFESSVLPIFVANCAQARCHDATRKEGYQLDTYANITRKGINAGNASTSKIYKVLFDGMPPDAPLSTAQKDSIKAWINQGAKNTTKCNCNCDPAQQSYAAVVKPLITNYCKGCHSGSSPDGGIDLSTDAGIRSAGQSGSLVGSIKHLSGFTAMPKGTTLSACQITQISGWVDSGMPNN